jgi:uncharacterized protein with ATP-grasp and redox domains
MLAENSFPPTVTAALEELFQGIPDRPLAPIHDPGAPDAADWAGYTAPYAGQNWLQVPWFLAETYFYRRILQLTVYFQPGPGQGLDPYTLQKRLGLEAALAEAEALALRLEAWRANPGAAHAALDAALLAALWGNQADLSLWPVDPRDLRQADAPQQEQLLVNDAPAIAAHLLALGNRRARVDLVLDNAGFELLCDLGLADALLWALPSATLVLHCKPHPTFVSDALAADVEHTLAWCAQATQPQLRALGARLSAALGSGLMRLSAAWFWTSPLSGWELPGALRSELARSNLIISKGDANYRRWLGDRHWPFHTPLAHILRYAPAPLALLRTLKSEVAAGLAPELPAALAAQDPAWLTAGRWGVAQFVGPI